jgi:hypothetical protein
MEEDNMGTGRRNHNAYKILVMMFEWKGQLEKPKLTYLISYLLTPWCRIFEKLIVTQLAKQ